MNIGFIGIGNMGGAVLSGYASSSKSDGDSFFVYDKDPNRCKGIEQEMEGLTKKILVCGSGREVCMRADLIMLGVKPHVMESVANEIRPSVKKDALLISMAAGVSIETLEGYFGKAAKIIRITPNLPVKVRSGMISVARNRNISDEELETVMELLGTIGIAKEADESLSDCIIGISGSSPAYTYMYIDALAQAAVEDGMSADAARKAAAQSVMDAAAAALDSQKHLEELWERECLSNEAIKEGVNKLMKNGFTVSVKEGFQAAVDRSAELTKAGRKNHLKGK